MTTGHTPCSPVFCTSLYNVYVNLVRNDSPTGKSPAFNNYIVVNNEHDIIESVEDLLPNAIYLAKQLNSALEVHLTPELPTPSERH